MKVKDLIELLQKLPQDYEVIMSSDGEGNNCSPLDSYTEGMYIPKNTYSGEFMLPGDFDEDDTEDEVYKENAIILWPTN